MAVDFGSGKRLWEVPADDSLENLTGGSEIDSNTQSPMLAALLSQRAWYDATFGTLSSDGHLVFGIEDLGLPLGIKPYRRGTNFSNPIVSQSLQSACSIRYQHRQTQMAGRWRCRRCWGAIAGEFFPWATSALDGSIVRAGGNKGRNSPVGAGVGQWQSFMVATIGSGGTDHSTRFGAAADGRFTVLCGRDFDLPHLDRCIGGRRVGH